LGRIEVNRTGFKRRLYGRARPATPFARRRTLPLKTADALVPTHRTAVRHSRATTGMLAGVEVSPKVGTMPPGRGRQPAAGGFARAGGVDVEVAVLLMIQPKSPVLKAPPVRISW